MYNHKILKIMTIYTLNKEDKFADYCLYIENMLRDKASIKRYCKTIADALKVADSMIIAKTSTFRLIRCKDGKNITNKIYK